MEFMLVESAAIFPHACICTSQARPLIDTFYEKPGYGRVYLCKLCVQRGARLFGFAAGERMDELQEASVLAERLEREIAGKDERISLLEAQLHVERQRASELGQVAEEVLAREQTRAHVAAEMERQAHALASVGQEQ